MQLRPLASKLLHGAGPACEAVGFAEEVDVAVVVLIGRRHLSAPPRLGVDRGLPVKPLHVPPVQIRLLLRELAHRRVKRAALALGELTRDA